MNKVFKMVLQTIVDLVTESSVIGVVASLIGVPGRTVRQMTTFRDTIGVSLVVLRIYLYGRLINETSADGSKNSQYVPDFIETRFEDLLSGGQEVSAPFVTDLNGPIITSGDLLDLHNYLELI